MRLARYLTLSARALAVLGFLSAPAAAVTEVEQPVDPEDPACCMVGSCCTNTAQEALSLPTAERAFLFPLFSTRRQSTPPAPVDECKDVSGVAPLELRREISFYQRSDHFAACADRARNLLAWRTRSGHYGTLIGDIAFTAAERTAYAESLFSYREACLESPGSSLANQILTASLVETILRSAGSVRARGGRAVCGGAIVGSTLVTARHCLGAPACTDEGACSMTTPDGWTFQTFSGNEITIPGRAVGPHEAALQGKSLADDWIGLDLGEAIADGTSVDIRAPRRWEPLVLFSPSVYASVLAAILRADEGDRASSGDLDLSPLCRASMLDGRLVMHACQTDAGASGSPLFGLDTDGGISVVAVQAGRADGIVSQCFRKFTDYYPNYGVTIPHRD